MIYSGTVGWNQVRGGSDGESVSFAGTACGAFAGRRHIRDRLRRGNGAKKSVNAGVAGSSPAPAASGSVKPSGKQELHLVLTGEPDSIDPSKVSFDMEITVAVQLFRGLFTFDPNLNLIPDLAAEMPTQQNGGISSDGLTYTFKLKPNQSWSDGQPVTSKNFAYSLQRELTPGTGGDYASYYLDIKGAAAFNGLKPDDPGLKTAMSALGIETPDDATLKVTLEKPDSVFLQHMGLWSAMPLREDVITKFGDKWTDPGNLIGNGPFLLKEWAHNDHITLVRNDKYSGADKPYLDTITMKIIEDSTQAYNAYTTGDVDLVSVPPLLVKTVVADTALKQQLYSFPEATVFWLGFNNSKPPFDTNTKLRQAISTAIDREADVASVFQGVSAKPAYSAIPPGIPGYDEAAGQQYKFNAAKAKQLLADAGFPNGQNFPKVSLLYAIDPTNQRHAEFIQQQLKQNIGLNIDLEPVDSKSLQTRFRANDFQLVFIGWGADYPDAENFMVPNFETGQGNNQEKYSNKDFDALVGKAYAENDPQKRIQDYQQAQNLMLNDAPVVMEIYRVDNFIRKPYVKATNNAYFSEPAARYMFWQYYYIQK